MTDKEILVLKIAEEVKRQGGEMFYVGGYVRDYILKRPAKDMDIETYGLHAEALLALLQKFAKVKTVGRSFAIFTVLGADLDIALPRFDKKIAEGHKGFEVVGDPFLDKKEACKRRDFTMNALMMNVLTHEVLDYFDGLKDIEQGIIRMVDDQHFAEDPLRVLRAARFAAQLGFHVEPHTVQICSNVSLSSLSKERLEEELKKALLSDAPQRYFETLIEMKQLDKLYSTLSNVDFSVLQSYEFQENVLLNRCALIARQLNESMRLQWVESCFSEKNFKKELYLLASLPMTVSSVYDYFPYFEQDKNGRCRAYLNVVSTDENLQPAFTAYDRFLNKEHVTAADLKALGFHDSPELGQRLKDIRRQEYQKDKEDILKEIKDASLTKL